MILITTPVANFELRRVAQAMSLPNQVAYGQRYALRQPEWRVEVFNDAGVLVLGAGPKGIVPDVWSHTPFTFGMNPEALQAKFEERAQVVLYDGHNMPTMLKCEPDSNYIYKDNRYYCDGIRMAWMMYVDQAIEHYNNKV